MIWFTFKIQQNVYFCLSRSLIQAILNFWSCKAVHNIPSLQSEIMLVKTHLSTQFGCFEIQGSELGITSVKKVALEPCPSGPVPPELEECFKQLGEYFRRERQEFDLKLDFGGAPEFNQAVWQELLKIPYGRTTSYLAIAEALNNPESVRAVGQANAHNPIPIIVPCHRCIAKSGDLHGYYYGLDMKRALLELENPLSFARQGNLFE
jgi:methylated-DNA-[protein]-cysteine S-methyltransferase